MLTEHVLKKENRALELKFNTREAREGLLEVTDKYFKYIVTLLENGCRFLSSEKILLVMTGVSTSKRSF